MMVTSELLFPMTNYADIVHSKLTPHEEGLSTIIANAWRGPFVHSFQMPQRKGNAAVWWNWRKQKGFVSETWTCSSLSDAAKQYAWDEIAKPSSETLRQNIINAIHRQDVEAHLHNIYQKLHVSNRTALILSTITGH